MSAGGYAGSAAHVTGTAAAGDYVQLGVNMCYASDLFDASAYDGFSFWAKAATTLPIQVKLAQENNDPQYSLCDATGSCYLYARAADNHQDVSVAGFIPPCSASLVGFA